MKIDETASRPRSYVLHMQILMDYACSMALGRKMTEHLGFGVRGPCNLAGLPTAPLKIAKSAMHKMTGEAN